MKEVKDVTPMPQWDRNAILNMLENGTLSKYCKIIGIGGNGIAYLYQGKQRYAIKIFFEDSCEKNDGEILEALQHHPHFPKLYFYHPQNFVVMQYIEGVKIQHTSSLSWVEDWEKSIYQSVEFILEKRFLPQDVFRNLKITKKGKPFFVDCGKYWSFDSPQFKERFSSEEEAISLVHQKLEECICEIKQKLNGEVA